MIFFPIPYKESCKACGYETRYDILRAWFFKELLIRHQKEVVESLRNPRIIEKIFEKNDEMLLSLKNKIIEL